MKVESSSVALIPMTSGRMKPDDPKGLVKLREQMMTFYARMVAAKKPFTGYVCNHCKHVIPTHCPTKEQVSSKGYWDSMTQCLACGRLNFVCIWPSGRTLSTKFLSGRSKADASTEYRHRPTSLGTITAASLNA